MLWPTRPRYSTTATCSTSLRAHGLEPMVTVNHFTLPAWVHDPITTRLLVQLGLPAPAAGWLSPTTPVEFEKYAAYLAWKYGDQVDNWATLNEPFPPILTQFLSPPIPGSPIPNWPPGVIRPDLASTFLVNQAKGHVAAYDAIHAWDNTVATDGQPEAFVGFTNNMIPARPANPVNPLDVQAADAWNSYYNHWFPNAVIDGWVDANFDGVKTADEVHADFVDKVDFMGVQYYGSQPMQGFGLAPVPGFPFLQGLPIRCAAESPTCSDFNQPTDPGGFREVLEVAASYDFEDGSQVPLWITENGIADAQRLETAELHREPHRGRAGPDRSRHGHPRLHLLVVRRQPRVGGWLPPPVRALRLRSHDTRARTDPEAGEHRSDKRDHNRKRFAHKPFGDVHPRQYLLV